MASDVDASRRSCVVISSCLMADVADSLLVAAMPSGHVEMQATMHDENPTLLLLRVGRPSDEAS